VARDLALPDDAGARALERTPSRDVARSPNAAAVARALEQKTPEESVDWQRLWLTTLRTPWRSLALVPIGPGIPTLRIAASLAEVGRHHPSGTILAHDATEVSLATLTSELSALCDRARRTDRSVVALPPLLASPAGIALARAVDALILCISLGESTVAEAEQVLAEVGRDRVLGSVIIRERKAAS
jgi:hypothetical protein